MKNKHIASWMLCSLFIMGCGSKVSDTVVSEKSLKEVKDKLTELGLSFKSFD